MTTPPKKKFGDNLRFVSKINSNIGGVGLDWPSRGMQLQDQFVNNRGEVVVHETAIACPTCRVGDVEDLFGQVTCEQCQAGGFIYKKPRQINALVTGISATRALQDFGWIIPGDCVMSLSPYLQPGVDDFDKITFTWPMTVDDGEVIIRGEWNQRYPTTFDANEDRIGYEAVESIACIDEDGNEYELNADFHFDNKKIVWISNNRPEIRKRYTVKYTAYFEWIVFNPDFYRRDSDRDIGNRVVLRKRHVAFLKHDREQQPPALRRSQLGFGDTVKV